MKWFKELSAGVLLIALSSTSVQAKEQQVPLAEIQSFVESFETISQGYVDELTDQQILSKALKGMVAALDPHSEYLTREEISKFREMTSGKYAGVGIEVEMIEGQLVIVSPIDGSPAANAGLRPGDTVLRIDDTLINDMGLQEVIVLMRGEIGTSIHLTIEREGDLQDFDIKRGLVQSASVTNKWLDDDVGYVRISQFQGSTGVEFQKALESMKAEHPLGGLVLDLRNNPGGVLQGAVSVVDAFLSDGIIVYTDGRHKMSKAQFNATKTKYLDAVPTVVLVNSGSASASEIVAGALQDHKRAVIMGTETFGKGTVQTVVPLTDGSAIKLTTALYYTPKGRSIQAQGIIPDMEVPQANLILQDPGFIVKEADLSGHIPNGLGGEDRNGLDAQNNVDDIANNDFQLFQALSVLKAFPKLVPQ